MEEYIIYYRKWLSSHLTITTNQNKSVNEVYNELLLKKILEQLIAGNNSFSYNLQPYSVTTFVEQ